MERIPLHSWEMEFSIQYHVTINSQLNDQNSIRYYINGIIIKPSVHSCLKIDDENETTFSHITGSIAASATSFTSRVKGGPLIILVGELFLARFFKIWSLVKLF